jgi:hypothetical protein
MKLRIPEQLPDGRASGVDRTLFFKNCSLRNGWRFEVERLSAVVRWARTSLRINPNVSQITGVICGYRVEDVE